MLLKKETIKKYITYGEEIEAYVYRRDDEIWFKAYLNNPERNFIHSQLKGIDSITCCYFTHTSIEEVEKFLNDLLIIEKIVIEKGYVFETFITHFWNPITDHLLFHWDQ